MPFNTFPGQIYSQSVQRELVSADVGQLIAVVHLLSQRDASFANSLISQAKERGSLSEKQLHWVRELAKRATADVQGGYIPAPAAAPAAKAFPRILELFAKAGSRAAIVFRTAHGDEFRLSVAGERSQQPGSINVTDAATGFDNRTWFGRITTAGAWQPSRKVPAHQQDAVEAAISLFDADPAAAAAQYGHLMGSCCFCRRELTDERSVTVGYGPVCADRFGLPWGEVPGGKPKLTAQAVSESDIPF